jgi:hypothetical protein
VSALNYRGKPIDSGGTVGYKSYVDQVKATVLTEASIDSTIASRKTPYALQSYVDSQDALRASTSYVNTQDAGKVLLSSKGQPSGPVPLDSSSLVSLTDLNAAGITERAFSYQYSSENMITANQSITSTSSMVNLGRIAIPYFAGGPPWVGPWIPLVWGLFECKSTSGATAFVEVRHSTSASGSTSGPVVARGFGSTRSADWHPLNVFPDAAALSGYTSATWPLPKATSNVTQYLHLWGRTTAATGVTIGNWMSQAVCLILPG